MKYVNSKLMQNIEEGQFQAIQFFLRNKRPDEWNKDQKQQVEHMVNLDSVLLEAKNRLDKGRTRDELPKYGGEVHRISTASQLPKQKEENLSVNLSSSSDKTNG